MQIMTERRTANWLASLLMGAALLLGSTGIAFAQEIEPNDFTPVPDGTNINLAYFSFGHLGAYDQTDGSNIPGSGGNAFIGVERFVHYDYLFGHPAGLQLFTGFGSISDPIVGGTNLGTATGVSNVSLSGFFFPYANFERKEYLIVAGFLYPPTGTYDKNKLVNFANQYQPGGQYNWTGDVQIGWQHSVGNHFSYDVAFDARFFGDTTGPIQPGSGIPLSVTTHHNNDYRLQLWLNWKWTPALRTAIGYEGWFGGLDYFDTPLTGTVHTGSSFEQRLRGAVVIWLSPRLQTVLEINGDVARAGGFRQTVGTELRIAYIF